MPEQNYSNNSVHQLKGIFFLRLFAALILLGSVNYSSLNEDVLSKPKTSEWLSAFISSNNLLSPSIFNVKVAEFQKTKKTIQQNSAKPEKALIQQVSNKQVEKLNPNPVHVQYRNHENYVIASLSSKDLRILPEESFDEIEIAANYVDVSEFGFDFYNKDEFISVEKQSFTTAEMLKTEYYNRWFISAKVGPQFVRGDILQPDVSVYEELSGVEEIRTRSAGPNTYLGESSYSMFMNVGYKINKSFDVSSGVIYSVFNGQQTAYYDSEIRGVQTIYTVIAVPSESGAMDYETLEEDVPYTNYFSDTVLMNYRMTSIKIPLMVRYGKSFGKWNTFLGAGASGVIKLRNNFTYVSNEIGAGAYTSSNNQLSSFNLQFNLGAEYMVTKEIGLQLSTDISSGLNIEDPLETQGDLSSFGVYGGFVYYFK